MSRSVLQPSQQKLAEKLTILNDRGVGMLTRLYNIKKVRTGRRGRAGVRRRGQGRGGGGRARPVRPGPRGGAAASSESRGRPGGSHFPGRLPGGRREPAGPRMAGAWVCGKGERARPSRAAAHGPGFLGVGVGECGARPSLRSPLGPLIFSVAG